MLLKTLRKVINTDLILYDATSKSIYMNVYCYGRIFKQYQDYNVVSIRTSACLSDEVYSGDSALVITISKDKKPDTL